MEMLKKGASGVLALLPCTRIASTLRASLGHMLLDLQARRRCQLRTRLESECPLDNRARELRLNTPKG